MAYDNDHVPRLSYENDDETENTVAPAAVLPYVAAPRVWYTITRHGGDRWMLGPVYTVDSLEGAVRHLKRAAPGVYHLWRDGRIVAAAVARGRASVVTFLDL